MHDRRRLLGRQVRGEQGVQLVGAGQVARPRGVELLLPAAYLPLEEALGPAEVREPHRGRVDGVQGGEGLDRPLRDGAGAFGSEHRQLRGGAVRRPVDPLHHVERRADHLLVLAQRVGARHRHGGVTQRGHHAVLPRHVVGGGQDVTERRPAYHPLALPVADDVGQVRLAAGDEAAGQRPGDLTRAGLLEERPERVEVEAGELFGHEAATPVASSSFACSFRMPASQRSVSVARSA